MIHVHRLRGQIVYGIGGWLISAREKVEDRGENHNYDSEKSQGPKGEVLLHTFSLTEFIDEAGSLSQLIPHRRTKKVHCLDHALICQMVSNDRSLTFRKHKSAFAEDSQMSR